MKSWGVLDKDGQWMTYKVSEEEARKSFESPSAQKLVKNIETDKTAGSETYDVVKGKAEEKRVEGFEERLERLEAHSYSGKASVKDILDFLEDKEIESMFRDLLKGMEQARDKRVDNLIEGDLIQEG